MNVINQVYKYYPSLLLQMFCELKSEFFSHLYSLQIDTCFLGATYFIDKIWGWGELLVGFYNGEIVAFKNSWVLLLTFAMGWLVL